mgnify:FL=1
MLDAILDAIIDSLKLLPFLFITYLLMELLENRASEKSLKVIKKSGKFGPILGSLLGIVPQCGFSAAAASLYAGKIISIGSLIAIFLSTSDEMLPILISSAAPINLIIKILLIKLIIGMVLGVIIDIIFKKKNNINIEDDKTHIHDICEDEHCHCNEDGILKSSIKHTLHIFIYVFIIVLAITILINIIGEDSIANIMTKTNILGPFVSSLIGIIPNCASSVIITQLYLKDMITFGSLIAGLLMNSGIGLLILFRLNKNKKENFLILLILFVISIISGIVIDLI